MKIYAARYTDCYHEYSPSVFSLHKTEEGAKKAIARSKLQSQESHKDQVQWCKENDFGFDTWTEDNGTGFERWAITEMEVEE
jgi:hypothetical protein